MRDERGWRIEREPEFSAEDVQLMLAAQEIQAETTSRGFTWAEEIDPRADPDHPENTHVFTSEPVRNYAIAAQERAQKEWRETWGEDADMAGLVWPVERIDRAS